MYDKKVYYNEDAEKEIWKVVPHSNGRYKISSKGRILDYFPYYKQRPEWQWTCDTTKPRELKSINGIFEMTIKGRKLNKSIHTWLKMYFPEIYDISEQRKKEIKQKIEIQGTITYNIDEFNRLIYPNKVLCIYNKFNNSRHNWKQPQKISIKDNQTFVLNKKYQYFGVGTLNLIRFDGLFPKNGKPYAEPPSKEYFKGKKESNGDYWENIVT